jgi:hypothetical protein
VVTRSVPPHAIVVGNPARIVGYVDRAMPKGAKPAVAAAPAQPGVATTQVRGVTLHHLKQVDDLRGNLSVGEFARDIPFAVKRYFIVYGVPSAETRGAHAHRTCHQFLLCVHGSCTVVADDGERRQEFQLDRPEIGVHLPPLVWGIQYKYSKDAVLLVFASEHYDAADYVRDYAEFLDLLRERGRA